MNTPQMNKARVAIGTAVPSMKPFGGGGYRPVAPWPCKRDHHPDNVFVNEKTGGLRCRVCDSEDRAQWRRTHLEHERRMDRERKRAKVAAKRAAEGE